MYVYKETDPGLYTVGYYTPGGEWIPESDHPVRENAAARVRYLNGGNLTNEDSPTKGGKADGTDTIQPA